MANQLVEHTFNSASPHTWRVQIVANASEDTDADHLEGEKDKENGQN